MAVGIAGSSRFSVPAIPSSFSSCIFFLPSFLFLCFPFGRQTYCVTQASLGLALTLLPSHLEACGRGLPYLASVQSPGYEQSAVLMPPLPQGPSGQLSRCWCADRVTQEKQARASTGVRGRAPMPFLFCGRGSCIVLVSAGVSVAFV